MQNYTTIIGVLTMTAHGASQRECQARYHIGSSTCQRILRIFKYSNYTLNDLTKMDEDKLINIFYPQDNLRRKKIPLPDFQKIYDRLMLKGSKANLFFLWSEYKTDNPDGYQLLICKPILNLAHYPLLKRNISK